MLTHSTSNFKTRKDKPLLIIAICIIWLLGTALFHSAWEPYEPFVLAVIQNIIQTNSWFVPYISGSPYLEIQPFYFWCFSIIIKIFHTDALETMRLINSILVFIALFVTAKIGSKLTAYKNGRTVALILISSIGFINYSYQVSPLIIPIIGAALVFYSIQNYTRFVTRAIILLAVGLSLLSFNFNCLWLVSIFISIAVACFTVSHLRNKIFYLVFLTGVLLFFVMFLLYVYQLYTVNYLFLEQWWINYFKIMHFDIMALATSFRFTLVTIFWLNIPQIFLVVWTLYKRKMGIFMDPVLSFSIIFLLVIILLNTVICTSDQSMLVVTIIPMTLLASVEVDRIRITVVSWLKWFSISFFGILILIAWLFYLCIWLKISPELNDFIFSYTQNYASHSHPVLLLLATLITFIWVTLVSRKGIQGREMITNYACGITCIAILCECLYLPIIDSGLDFKYMVKKSTPYINNSSCVATNENNNIQSAVWYYYGNISLVPVSNINNSGCKQAIISNNTKRIINYGEKWHTVWQYQRPVDKVNGRFYMLLNYK